MKNLNTPITSASLVNNFIKKVLAIKYVYIALIFIFIITSFVLNKYSNNIYQVQASILLSKNNKTAILNSGDFFRNGEFMADTKNVEDEVNMLSSFALVAKTISSLNLEVAYYSEKNDIVKKTNELYEESPFIITIDKSHLQAIDAKFYVEILNDSVFRISAKQKKVALYNYIDNKIDQEVSNFFCNKLYRFNQTISTDKYQFSVALRNKGFQNNDPKTKYYFQLYHLDYLTSNFLSRLRVEPQSATSSIINVNFNGENIGMITTFLNKYIDLYFNANLEKKNKTSTSTIQFIDTQITSISDSLTSAESKLRNYKSSNQVMDLSFQGQRIFDQKSQFETERSNMEAQKRYYNYIINYFETNKDVAGISPPSAMNIIDPILNQLITELLSLNSQHSDIVSSNSTKSLYLLEIDNKIKIKKKDILENVKNNLNTLNLSLNELEYRYNKLSEEIARLPKTEMKLFGLERKYKLNDAIVTFLLQKREEASISKESNLPDYEILSPAREISAYIIYPKKSLNYLIALMFALLLPSVFIILRDLINNKILSVTDIEYLSKKEVIGNIYSNKYKTEIVVPEYPNSFISESFRTLRTLLLLKLNSENAKVILVTSSIPGEGKSFVSLNLASSLAALGIKTALIDCDLRRSSLHTKLNIENSVGLSSHLVNKALITDIIIKTSVSNLYFVPAGPKFPNPSELLQSDNCISFFDYLKSNFGYIIIDSPPLSAVADSYVLMKYAERTIIITRSNYTRKETFANIISSLEANNMNKFDIVFNDINFKKSSNGQQYGKYYSEEKASNKTVNHKTKES